MQPQLRSTIDLTPLIGLLLAMTALVLTVVPENEAFAPLEIEPPVYPVGSFEPPQPPWRVTINAQGELWLSQGESRSRLVEEAEILNVVPASEQIVLHASAEARYEVFAVLAAYLDANGRRVAVVNEDLH